MDKIEIDDVYNTTHYPHLVAVGDSNWDYYANDAGRLASIAKVPGCRSTMFGDALHLYRVLMTGTCKHVLTEYGRKLLGEKRVAWLPAEVAGAD